MPTAPPVHRPRKQAASEPQQIHRSTTTELGYNYRWRQARLRFLMSYPLCASCEEKGLVTAANEVDHIIPHKGDQSLFWDEGNWQSLCKPCHSRKTAGEAGLIAAILPRFIKRTVKPLTVVAGPPAAGKTAYVKQHADAGDLVLDLDAIATQLGLNDSRSQEGNDRARIALLIRERNDRLARFARGSTKHSKCWLIATAGSFRQRKFWQDLGASVVVVNPGAVVCRQRVMAEAITEPAKRSRLLGIDRWC